MPTIEDYLAAGYKIFPCFEISRGVCSCSKGSSCNSPGKHPRTPTGLKEASRSPETISAWVARWPHANWALACGADSGVVVIDIDTRKGGFDSIEQLENDRPQGSLPDTLRASTGGGGRHLFFAYPQGEVISNRTDWLPGVDFKTDGGYVILPPSNHISGATYQWINWGSPLAPMPRDVLESLQSNSAGGSTGADLPDTSTVLQGIPEGRRDDVLFRACCRWRRQLGDDQREAVTALALLAASRCDPIFPPDQALKCVASAFRQDHNDDFTDLGTDHGDAEVFALTDIGNARRFVESFGDQVRFVNGWDWMVWTPMGWRRDNMAAERMAQDVHKVVINEARSLEQSGSDLRVVRQYTNWAQSSQSAASMSNMLKTARSDLRVLTPIDAYDANDFHLGCRNGVIDLRTGLIMDNTQDLLITKNTNVVYDPSATWPAWDKFIYEACDGDRTLVDYLQRAAGYTLTGSNASEAFFLISGPPASGKSTFLDGMHAALGEYASSTQADTFMYRRGQPPPVTELARLAGTRLVSVSEIKEGENFSEQMIKQITGGDMVTARFLYRDAFEFRPQFKLWLGTNHEPEARDDALWRRLKLIRFPRSIPKEDRDPQLKISMRDSEIGGRAVLAWAVRGAIAWHEAGGLHEPASVQVATDLYRADQDRPGQFIRECLNVDLHGSLGIAEAYQTYQTWCENVGERKTSRGRFIKMMESRNIIPGTDDQGRVVLPGVTAKQMIFNQDGVTWQ